MAVVYLTYSSVSGTMLILTKFPSRLPTDLLNAFVMSCMIFLPRASVVGDQNWTVTTPFAGAASAVLAPVPASAAPAAVAPAACRNVRRLSFVPVLICTFSYFGRGNLIVTFCTAISAGLPGSLLSQDGIHSPDTRAGCEHGHDLRDRSAMLGGQKAPSC